MRDKIFNIMEGTSELLVSRLIGWFIMFVILVCSAAFILESVPEIYERHRQSFEILEVVVVAIFTAEYAIRFATCRNKWRWALRPLNVIDLLAILPFYLTLLLPMRMDLRIIRIVRLVRIFRMFKMARYSESFQVTLASLKDASSAFVSLLLLVLIVLVMCSSFMYTVEHDSHVSYCPNYADCGGKWVDGQESPERMECPKCKIPLEAPIGKAQVSENFRSIVKTSWWCIVTMTTVGYGDVVPQTPIGKMIAAFTMLLGILCIALPTGIMATSFMNNYEQARKRKAEKHADTSRNVCCPHCNREFKL